MSIGIFAQQHLQTMVNAYQQVTGAKQVAIDRKEEGEEEVATDEKQEKTPKVPRSPRRAYRYGFGLIAKRQSSLLRGSLLKGSDLGFTAEI